MPKYNLPEFGCSHEQLAACLSLVMMQDRSYSKVVMLGVAIANKYRICMLPSPTTLETVSALFRRFKNARSQERSTKQPITEEILDKLYTWLYKPGHGRASLHASLVLWRISMEYHTLGRFSDIVKLRKNDVISVEHPSPHLKILF